jgi:hypothetical protein
VPNDHRQRGWLLLGVLSALIALWQVVPGGASSAPRAWDRGTVRVYDASGMRRTVIIAASRWNASRARARLREVDSPREADVIVRVDDRRLLSVCGSDCLGYAFSIGRPRKAPTEVLLAGELAGLRTRCRSGWQRTNSGTCSVSSTATAAPAR